VHARQCTYRVRALSGGDDVTGIGSHAVAVTSPGKCMVAAASKGRGIGRGNFYVPLSLSACETVVCEVNFVDAAAAVLSAILNRQLHT